MSQEPDTTPDKERQTVLAPYLARLRAMQSGRARSDDLHLDAWERSVLEKANGAADAPDCAWAALVAEGIAFRTKYEADLHRLMNSAPDAVDVVHAQLTTDAAVGLALMTQTQQTVNLMVLSGKIDAAKKLAGFRNKLAQGVWTIRDAIGATAFHSAEALSKKMTSVAEPARSDRSGEEQPSAGAVAAAQPDAGERLDVDALLNQLPDPFIRRAPTSARATVLYADVATPRRIKGLAVVLATLVVVWAVLVLPRLDRAEPLPILTEQDLPGSAAIQALIARPPSLFVEVDVAAWRTMSATERRQWVKEVGELAQDSGYRGVQFRDTSGNSVAQWLHSQGVWLANAAASN